MGLIAIFIGISKGHILKVDGSISDFFDPIFWRVNRRFGRQDSLIRSTEAMEIDNMTKIIINIMSDMRMVMV